MDKALTVGLAMARQAHQQAQIGLGSLGPVHRIAAGLGRQQAHLGVVASPKPLGAPMPSFRRSPRTVNVYITTR